MPKQLVHMAFKSPFALLAVGFVLYMAAHSFVVAIFVAIVVIAWVKRSIQAKLKGDGAPVDTKAGGVPNVPSQPKVVEEHQVPVATPIKRQYAKSAVVIPFKTGTGN